MNKPIGILVTGEEAKKEVMELLNGYKTSVSEEEVEKSEEYIVTVSIIHKTLI